MSKNKSSKLVPGNTYQIAFTDPNQPSYTHFVGKGILLKKSDENFDTVEQH